MMTNEVKSAPISLSEGAVKEIKRLMAGRDDAKVLRLGVKGGGCAGFSYVLEFDDIKAEDEQMHFDDITVVVDFSHLLYLNGLLVDFAGGLNNRGFTFDNPNATKTCGCGSSFG
jgi:iron-sulfur cluster assembly protein